MAITKEDKIVGHVPRKMFAACFLFLGKKENIIKCKVNGKRTYSQDLPQGGLKFPVMFKFQESSRDIHKIIKLLASPKSELEPPYKKFEVEESDDAVNVKSREKLLNVEEKEVILQGGWLTDVHINFAQQLLSKQFTHLSWLALYLDTLTCRKYCSGW